MAKITPGSIVTLVSGKLGGSVFTSSPNGMQIRPRAKLKRNVNFNFRNAKQVVSSAASSWRALTEAQRAAWIAATADYTHPDRLGNTIMMTGLQLYVAISMAHSFAGTPFTTAAPSPESYPSILFSEVTCEEGFFRIDIDWDDTPINSAIALYATGPLSAGISSYSKSDLFWMDSYSNDNPFQGDFTGQWEQRFGAGGLHIGKKIFVELWVAPLDTSDILRFVSSGNDIIFS